MDKLEAYLPSSAGSRTSTTLRHLRHALAVQPNFTDTFYPREDVIHSLAADPHQFRADNPRNEITRQIENLLRCGAVESFAKNGRHSASKRLHFRTERHANVCLASFIYVQINTDGIGALLIFAHIDEIKIFAVTRLLLCRIVCIRNERLASFVFRQRLKKIDDFVQLTWTHRIRNLPLIFIVSFRAKPRNPIAERPVKFAGCLDFARHDMSWLWLCSTKCLWLIAP